ncbi:hypothetical protein GN956_G15150 [Arapaima gigas]
MKPRGAAPHDFPPDISLRATAHVPLLPQRFGIKVRRAQAEGQRDRDRCGGWPVLASNRRGPEAPPASQVNSPSPHLG